MDLANKSGKYLRDLSDWWYLCRKCHMTIDGRIEKVQIRMAASKIPIPPCYWCDKVFYRPSGQRTAKFCSSVCFRQAGGKSWRKFINERRISNGRALVFI